MHKAHSGCEKATGPTLQNTKAKSQYGASKLVEEYDLMMVAMSRSLPYALQPTFLDMTPTYLRPIRTVPLTPADPMHATDTHSLASHPVTPIRPAPLYPCAPSPAQLTVTDAQR